MFHKNRFFIILFLINIVIMIHCRTVLIKVNRNCKLVYYKTMKLQSLHFSNGHSLITIDIHIKINIKKN